MCQIEFRENVPIRSIGASLTLVVPSASVAFSAGAFDGVTPRSRSVIVSAGPFHNLIFWLVLTAIERANLSDIFWRIAYQDIAHEGRIVVNVAHVSCLL
jgi:S2P endopeptidase